MLLPLAFAPFGLWPLAIVIPATLFCLLDKDMSGKRLFLHGWLFGNGYFGVGIYWTYNSLHEFGQAPPIVWSTTKDSKKHMQFFLFRDPPPRVSRSARYMYIIYLPDLCKLHTELYSPEQTVNMHSLGSSKLILGAIPPLLPSMKPKSDSYSVKCSF